MSVLGSSIYHYLSTARSYFKNNGFEVTGIKLLNKDTCQPFKAHQEEDGGESYVLNFLTTGRIVIKAKNAPARNVTN